MKRLIMLMHYHLWTSTKIDNIRFTAAYGRMTLKPDHDLPMSFTRTGEGILPDHYESLSMTKKRAHRMFSKSKSSK